MFFRFCCFFKKIAVLIFCSCHQEINNMFWFYANSWLTAPYFLLYTSYTSFRMFGNHRCNVRDGSDFDGLDLRSTFCFKAFYRMMYALCGLNVRSYYFNSFLF